MGKNSCCAQQHDNRHRARLICNFIYSNNQLCDYKCLCQNHTRRNPPCSVSTSAKIGLEMVNHSEFMRDFISDACFRLMWIAMHTIIVKTVASCRNVHSCAASLLLYVAITIFSQQANMINSRLI